MNSFFAILKHDVVLQLKSGGGSWFSIAFFLVAVSLFPLGIGPDLPLLSKISAGVIWVVALLAALLSLERIFQADFEDGSLDLLMLCPLPLEGVVMAKTLAHWLVTGVPLVIASPFLALMLNIDSKALFLFVLTVLVGTPALSFIGTIGAALAVALRRSGALIAILVLPLYIPTLIFGVGAVDAVVHQGEPAAALSVMIAVSLGAMALAPFAGAAALRAALQ